MRKSEEKEENKERKKKKMKNFIRSHVFVWEGQRINKIFLKCVNNQVLGFL